MKAAPGRMLLQVAGLSGYLLLLVHYVLDCGILGVGMTIGTRELVLHGWTAVGFSLATLLFFGSWRPLALAGVLAFHLLLPLFGPLFMAAMLVSIFFSSKHNLFTDFHEEDKKIREAQKAGAESSSADNLHEKKNIEPIVEVLHGHAEPDIKRGAIETLANICNPESIQLLKECLSDQNVEVRFYASSGLSRIEERLNGDIVLYKKRMEKGDRSVENLCNLGRAYYEFVYLQMQDESSLAYYIGKAIECYEEVVRHPEALDRHRQFLQKAYTRAGRHEEARALNTERAGGARSADNIMYLAEAYFKEGDFASCKRLISSPDFEKLHWKAVADVRELWLTGGRAS